MSKITILMAAAAVTVVGSYAAVPAPASAQQNAIAEIIVYGNDPCPRSTDDQVVVCARRPEAERYRLPPNMRPGGTPQQRTAWAQRAKSLETVGRTGINSCSPVGPAGHTGCLIQVIEKATGERKQQAHDETPPQP